MSGDETWYIVKQPEGHCAIVQRSAEDEKNPDENSPSQEQWGPYRSQAEAIARRVGLIRAGKCQPV